MDRDFYHIISEHPKQSFIVMTGAFLTSRFIYALAQRAVLRFERRSEKDESVER